MGRSSFASARRTVFRTSLQAFTLSVALCGLAAIGCNSGGSNENEIRIGHFASLTGSEATFGQSTDNGIKMAVEEINEAGGVGGKQIAVITYDDKGDSREAGTVVTRLITLDNVAAVLGEVASGLSLAGAPICQEYGIPMVSPSSTNERAASPTGEGGPRCLRSSGRGTRGRWGR